MNINSLPGGGFRNFFQGGRFSNIADMTAPPPPAATGTGTPTPTTGAPTPAMSTGNPQIDNAFGGAFSTMADKTKDIPLIGDIFSRLGKNGAGNDVASTPGAAPYTKLDTTARTGLLNAMLSRARGGQPGGAPNTPLPAPGANVPTA